MIRRQRVFLVVAVVAAALSLAGLGASTLVKSPAQRAVEQGPPKPSILTARVQEKVLRNSLAVRGTVTSGHSVSVTAVAPSGATLAVLSALPKGAGDRVTAGDVIAEVSGRPIIALPGAVPAYRDLKPGDTGPDVRQLQQALRKLGFRNGDRAGVYGMGTQRAVSRLYRNRGYPAITTEAAGTATSARTGAGPAVGIELPRSEVAFVSSFPATVDTVRGQVGSVLTDSTGPFMTLSTQGLVIRATVPSGQQQLIKAGQAVTIEDDARGRTVAGSVTSLGGFSSGGSGNAASSDAAAGGQLPDAGAANGAESGGGTAGYPLVVAPSEPLTPGWLGANVLLSIATASTGHPVMVVPAAAITTTADGQTSVTVLQSDGTQRRVPVAPGATANGEVQVAPRNGANLVVNDAVVTGTGR